MHGAYRVGPAYGVVGPAYGVVGPAYGVVGPAYGVVGPAYGVVGGLDGDLPGIWLATWFTIWRPTAQAHELAPGGLAVSEPVGCRPCRGPRAAAGPTAADGADGDAAA